MRESEVIDRAAETSLVCDPVPEQRVRAAEPPTGPIKVLVTVGTDHHPFDRLVSWVDQWLETVDADVDCLVQHGTSAVPTRARGEAYLAGADVVERMAESAAVVCHGGPGTIAAAREAGVTPIVVPRRHSLGEHVDDHQVAFTDGMRAKGAFHVVDSAEELWAALDAVVADPERYRIDAAAAVDTETADRIAVLIDETLRSAREWKLERSRTRRASSLLTRSRTASMTGPHQSSQADRPNAPSSSNVPVLCIGGNGRSGSTLLGRMLGLVPGMTTVGEFVFVWPYGLRDNQLCGCGESFLDCPFWTSVGEHAFGGWDKVDLDEVLALQHSVDRHRYLPLMLAPRVNPQYHARLVRYTEILGRIYYGVQQASGCEVVVDTSKHPSYAYLLRQVAQVDLRMLHLVRVSHGVCYSWTKQVRRPEVTDRQDFMRQYAPSRMACDWSTYNLLVDGLQSLRIPTLTMRYEDLVRSPEPNLDAIVEFAGLQRPTEGYGFLRPGGVELPADHSISGNPMRFKVGAMPLRVDDEWRSAMDKRTKALVTAITLPGLVKYGYLRPGSRSGPESLPRP